MRNLLWVSALLLWGCSSKKLSQEGGKGNIDAEHPAVQASPDTIPLRQVDGTILHIIGYGNIFINYTETVDGYTVVRDDIGLYEYAKSTKDGDLKPSYLLAHDPDKRDKKEIKFLEKTPKHLRYSGAKLQKLLEHKLNHDSSTIRRIEFVKPAPKKKDPKENEKPKK